MGTDWLDKQVVEFIAARCELDARCRVSAWDLFSAYKKWAVEADVYRASKVALGRALTRWIDDVTWNAMGEKLVTRSITSNSYYLGLKLKDEVK